MNPPLPYGIADLDPEPQVHRDPPRRVRCYVRGCGRWLRPPAPGQAGEFCPNHGIRSHLSRFGPSYSYAEPVRNVVASPRLFTDRLLGHPFKVDTGKLGFENSEDALTWNVFRSLQEAGRLKDAARLGTGLDLPDEPRLYLWGLSLSDDRLEPWPLLVEARRQFESALPVKRPPTEPDIVLHLPGRYLLLIEAKFMSANPSYEDGPRRDAESVTKGELLDIYRDPALQILDAGRARAADRVYYQLWRNTVFAEWMAGQAGDGTVGYHANLTREGAEIDSCREFRSLLRPGFEGRFAHLAWEQLYHEVVGRTELEMMRRYLENKTAGLRPAFCINTGF